MRLSGELVERREPAASPAAKDGMSRGIVLSVALHLAIGGLIVFGLPDLLQPAPPLDEPIAVDLVKIGPQTLATHPNPYVPRPQVKPDLPVADMPAPPPRPKPQPPRPAPPPSSGGAPPQPLPAKVEKAEREPLPKPPLPKPPPPKPSVSKAAAMPRPATPIATGVVVPRPQQKPRPPIEIARREPRPRPERTPERVSKTYNPGAFDALLKNLAPENNAPSPDRPPQLKRLVAAAASSQPQAPLGAALTASEIDLIRQQIERCWNIPEGARDDRNLVVEIKVFVEPDGDVRKAVILDQARMANDPVFRAAADSARRALFDPQCRPLRLPPDKYQYWKEFVVDFSPRDLL
jgi:hypothetical protein